MYSRPSEATRRPRMAAHSPIQGELLRTSGTRNRFLDWHLWGLQGGETDSGFSLQTGEHQSEFESTHLVVELAGRERQSRVSGVAN